MIAILFSVFSFAFREEKARSRQKVVRSRQKSPLTADFSAYFSKSDNYEETCEKCANPLFNPVILR